MSRWLPPFAALMLVLATLVPAGAQLPGAGGSRIGVGRSPGRDDPAMREVGSELELRIANGVTIIIAHAKELQLSSEQLTKVAAIKRQLDSLNTPLMRELDSLERSHRQQPGFRMPGSRRDTPDESDPRLDRILDLLRTNMHAAEQDAYEVLSGTQLQQTLQLVKEARTNAALMVGRDRPPK